MQIDDYLLDKSKVLVKRRRLAVTHGCLLQVACHSFVQAETAGEGAFDNLISSMIFSAFAMEAYLNHVGTLVVPSDCWLERSSPRRKLATILKTVELQVDFSKRPFSSFEDLFRFRNALAHGRTEYLEDEYEAYAYEGNLACGPMTQWESQCTAEHAGRFLSDAAAVMMKIHEKVKLDEAAIGYLGFIASGTTLLLLQDIDGEQTFGQGSENCVPQDNEP